MPRSDQSAAALDAAATVRVFGGSRTDLERAAYGYVADRIRESGERITADCGVQRVADFVESLAIELDQDGLCACCGDSAEVISDLCSACRGAGCTTGTDDCTPGPTCPMANDQ